LAFVRKLRHKLIPKIDPSSSLEETRVETSSSDHRTTRDESLKDVGMASTMSAILMQVKGKTSRGAQLYC
jgi:hypothetical protein